MRQQLMSISSYAVIPLANLLTKQPKFRAQLKLLSNYFLHILEK